MRVSGPVMDPIQLKGGGSFRRDQFSTFVNISRVIVGYLHTIFIKALVSGDTIINLTISP